MTGLKRILGLALLMSALSATAATPPPDPQPAKVATTTHDVGSSPTHRATDASVNGAVTVNYTYDSLGRLIQESYPAQSSGYTYDAAGNRTQAQTQ
jgi:YD repeat-containing protein